MEELRIRTSKDIELSFDLIDHRLIFTGSNHESKWKIYQLFKRVLGELKAESTDEDFFGESGPEILLDGVSINKRKILAVCIDQVQDLLNCFNLAKGSLFFDYLSFLTQDLTINYQVERINDEVMILENMINSVIKEWSETFESALSEINILDYLKKFSQLCYLKDDLHVPSYSLAVKEYLDDFIKLIDFQLAKIGKPTWVILYCPESFMSKQSLDYFITELERISRSTQLLKYFIFHNSGNVSYTKSYIRSLVLCHDRYDQLPDYYYLRKSIERHYPIELIMSDEELITRLNRIFSQIGKSVEDCAVGTRKDMVLLKVLNVILGLNDLNKTLFDDLTQTEINYLMK